MLSSWNPLETKTFEAIQASWPLPYFVLPIFVISALLLRDFEDNTKGVNAPLAGRWPLEPYFLTGLRFKFGSMAHLADGYSKFKDQMFKVMRSDGTVLVIPTRFVEEFRSLPEHRLSPRQLQVYNLYGKSTTTDILLKSDLQIRMLRHRFNPNLATYVPGTLQEIEYAVGNEFPEGDQWTPIKINHNLLYVISGIMTRAFSGTSLCRNRRWHSTSISYVENIITTMLILRFFPRSLHQWISGCLPSSWITHIYLRRAKKILVPIIEERMKALNSVGDSDEKPLDLLQYMIEEAKGDELQPEFLAHLELMANLVGIHTSSMAITHAILDLCEYTEYVTILREEIEKVLREDGGWQRNTHDKLHKMDSFLKESQRFSPITLLSFHRVVQTQLTLSSGLVLPAGTHFGAAARNIMFDPDVTPNPDVFDGLRYFNMRANAPESHKYEFTNLDPSNLNFGAGRYACPGRFLASMALKLLLAHLLLKFDFKFRPGQRRPTPLVIDEILAPKPWTKILVRRR